MRIDTTARVAIIDNVPRRVQRPSLLYCGFLLLAVKTGLKVWGFQRTFDVLTRLTRQGSAPTAASMEILTEVAETVATAAAFFPGRAKCLEQSLALLFLFRRAWVPVSLHLGVEPHRFRAHSWVEYRGEPILEDTEVLKRFVRLPSVNT